MKFGVHLRLLAKPDWAEFYINYALLKNIVKGGSVDDGAESDASNEGSSRRLVGAKRRRAEGDDGSSADIAMREFVAAIKAEAKRAETFYTAQQAECLAQLERAAEVVARASAIADATTSAAPGGASAGTVAAVPEGDVSDSLHPPASAGAAATAAAAVPAMPLSSAISAAQAAVNAVSDFIDDLRSFSSLNVTAVEKASKKFDKTWGAAAPAVRDCERTAVFL